MPAVVTAAAPFPGSGTEYSMRQFPAGLAASYPESRRVKRLLHLDTLLHSGTYVAFRGIYETSRLTALVRYGFVRVAPPLACVRCRASRQLF